MMKYTIGEIGYVYKIVDLKCCGQVGCTTCEYEKFCPMLDTIKVTIDDDKFITVAEQILRSC